MNKNSNSTKNYICEAFFILLSKQHYDSITVCDICEKAGVSRMSFYRNFESKEDLLSKGLDASINNFKNKIQSYDNINQYIIIKELFEGFKKYKDIVHSLLNTQVLKTLRYNAMYKLKEEIVIDQMNKTSKYIPIFYISALSSTLFEWLRDGAQESSDEMARLIVSLTGNIIPDTCSKS